MVKYLCVAEKPSIAKSITQILSGGQFQTRSARNPKWIKLYDFQYRMPPTNACCDFTVTAVAGHLTSSDFDARYKGWHSCDPFALFEAEIKHFTNPDPAQRGIEANLLAEARRATHLMIWTDCDREGEHIGSEVAAVCRKANPNIVVKRARFSAIIANQINNACRNPVDLDMLQANAVAARMDLDLRVGAAFTRSQTLGLQARFATLAEQVMSYGPCQFPTLGFVVEQYERCERFLSEPFWSIYVAIEKDGESTPFLWKRGRLYDQEVVEALLKMCLDDPEATVTSQQTKPTQKWKPLPLTTVELQKTGSRLLRLAPKTILDIAEKLYQQGFLSYPRTETDEFDADFDFDELIQKQKGDGAWGQFATNLVNGGFERPRNGKNNDKAHPPIHPTAHASNLAGDDKRVYELVTRRFLACCSKNGRGLETTVEIDIAGEIFSAHGLVVLERNYLDVYIYDKWNGNYLPEFQVGENFEPDVLEIKEGRTTQPSLLTEADLVSLMDKNGIGTDATIAEHIAKIIDRQYVFKQRDGNTEYLVPSTLGVGLVKGYNAIGFERSLCKPDLRRLTEHRMNQICQGLKTKQQVIDQTLDEYRDMFMRTRAGFQTFLRSVAEYVEGDAGQDAGGPVIDDDSDDDAPGPPAGRGRGRGRGGQGQGRGAARGRGGANAAPARGQSARGGGAGGRRDTAAARGRGGARQAPPKHESDDEDDKPDLAENQEAPTCDCNEPAVEKTVTSNDKGNKGRVFWTCSKGMQNGCGFFQWRDSGAPATASGSRKRPLSSSDQPNRGPRQRAAPPQPPQDVDVSELRCDCDMTPAVYTVQKEGPNQGKSFLRCPNSSTSSKCKFFKWLDENGSIVEDDAHVGANRVGGRPSANAGRTASSGSGHGAGQTGTCFQCGQEGHWFSNCPQKAAGGSNTQGGGSSGECFICHQSGHWSRDCPQKNSAGPSRGAKSTGGGSSNYSCFRCGQQGHFSSACPNEDSGYGSNTGRGRGVSRGRSRGRGRARGKR